MFYHAFKIILRVLSLNLIGAFNFFYQSNGWKNHCRNRKHCHRMALNDTEGALR